MTNTGRPPAAWYPDPTGRHQHRYWDGERWTVSVANDGVTAIDDGRQHQRPVAQATPAAANPAVATPVQPTETVVQTTGRTAVDEYVARLPVASTPSSSPPGTDGATRPAGVRRVVAAIAIVVAMAGVGTTAVLALSRDPKPDGTSQAADRYPAAIETAFLNSCTANGGTVNYCRCALTQVEQDYDLAAFSDAEQQIVSTGQMPQDMKSAVLECVPQQVQK